MGCCCGHGRDRPNVVLPESCPEPEKVATIISEVDDRDWRILQWRLVEVNEIVALKAKVTELEELIEVYEDMVDRLIDHCEDAECMKCAVIVCPHEEPLHFHHDGCPCCHDCTKEQYHELLRQRIRKKSNEL